MSFQLGEASEIWLLPSNQTTHLLPQMQTQRSPTWTYLKSWLEEETQDSNI